MVGSFRKLPKPQTAPPQECAGSIRRAGTSHPAPQRRATSYLLFSLLPLHRPASETLNCAGCRCKDREIVAAKLEKPEGTRLCFVFLGMSVKLENLTHPQDGKALWVSGNSFPQAPLCFYPGFDRRGRGEGRWSSVLG